MKKSAQLILFAALGCSVTVFSQSDSVPRSRHSFIQADIGVLPYYSGPRHSAEDFKALAGDEPLLFNDFSKYSKSGGIYGPPGGSAAFLSVRYGSEMAGKKKGSREWSLGLRFGRTTLSAVSYYHDTLLLHDLYTGVATGNRLVHYKSHSHVYQFAIGGRVIYVPASYAVISNRKKWIRVSAGLEVAPGLVLAPEFVSLYYGNVNDVIVPEGTPTTEYYKYYTYSTGESSYKSNRRALGGAGFAGYVSLPLTLNIGGPPQVPVAGRIRVFATLSPSAVFYYYRFTGGDAGYSMGATAGIRYRL